VRTQKATPHSSKPKGHLMNEFNSWQSYSDFKKSVKNQNRYFRNIKTEQFLNTALITSKKRKLNLTKGRVLWRAQLGHDWQPMCHDDGYVADIPAPFPPDRMKPLDNVAVEGRANPKGIPYLYLATEKETAMAEVRPWLGSKISVGQFKTVKNMVLVNCSNDLEGFFLYLEEPSAEKKEQAVWQDISNAFSEPITNNDKLADYIPTQILAEFFKNEGFDGLYYKSMLGEGYNIVLFGINRASLVKCYLFEANNIKFGFQKSSIPYVVSGKEKGL
jgi:hypothetical protein